MRNFHFIVSYNVSHPAVKDMLDRTKLTAMTESLTDIRIRSKHYLNFEEACENCQADFYRKLPALFPVKPGMTTDEAHEIVHVTVMNPIFAVDPELAAQIAERFGDQQSRWDDNCCGTMFFCEADQSDDEGEMMDDEVIDQLPSTWLFKYEICFEDDAIDYLKNGGIAFNKASIGYCNFTSVYH
jgi:hypothetical protein